MAEYEFFLTDASGAWLAQVDHYLGLELRFVFNGVGKWVLELPGSGVGLFTWGRRLLVRRDGEDFFSGPMFSSRHNFSGPMFSSRHNWEAGIGTEVDEITVLGYDDAILLDERILWPEVTGNFAAQAYDVRTGACETVLKQYVDYNAGPNAILPRRQGITIEVDAAKGGSVTGRARFNPMLPFLAGLAEVGGGLGFRVLDLQFQVYQPMDMSATVKFSQENGMLSGFDYDVQASTGNHVLVLGGGEGTARTIHEMQNSASILRHRRIETIKDRRDTTIVEELAQAGQEELYNHQESVSLALMPKEVDGMRAYTDWWLGDKVVAVVDGETITQVLREIKVTMTPDKGEVISPILRTSNVIGGDHPLVKLLGMAKSLDLRMNNQERR